MSESRDRNIVVDAQEVTPDKVRPGPKSRPRLAIVANAPSPYRLSQHTRIAHELPELELFSCFKHEKNNSAWKNPLPAVINPVVFGPGEAMTDKNKGFGAAFRQWGRGGEIIGWLKSAEIDAVIITGYNDLGLLRVIRWCKSSGVPCFMFNDSNKFGDRARGPAKLFKKFYVPSVLGKLTGLMPCGTRGVEYYLPYGSAGKPAFYMPHEPNYKLIMTLPDEPIAAMREKWGIDPNRRLINYCARMTGVKRPDLLVEAFAQIVDERSEWDLMFVGGGDLLEETRALVPERLQDRVMFTGFVDGPENVGALYKLADIHVLPSDYEPWAAVIPEACAAGLAVIASEVVGAAAELVKPGVNGDLFKKGDADDLARALRDVTDPSKIETYRRGSRDVLTEWRRRGDPIDGARRALEFSGILEPRSGVKPTGDPERDWRTDYEAGVHALATSTFDRPDAHLAASGVQGQAAR